MKLTIKIETGASDQDGLTVPFSLTKHQADFFLTLGPLHSFF